MTIVDNLDDNNNHRKYILDMINMSDELFITSPFLMRNFSQFFTKKVLLNIKKINLITTLQPNSLDQLKKVYSLISLIEIPKIESGEIECSISLNNKLHGKIYIFKKNGTHIGGLISSANFTDNGLWLNHEWGIALKEKDELLKLENSIINSIEPNYFNLSHESIKKLLEHLKLFDGKDSTNNNDEIDLDLTQFLKKKKPVFIEKKNSKTYEYKITDKYLVSWQKHFIEFIDFKKKNNEITVPRDYENNSLYQWYRKQKIFFANGTIPLEHKSKLEKVGFYFGDGHEIRWARIWEENYELLKAYYDEYGNSDVPHTNDNKDTFYTLGNWVASQKTYNNNNVLSDYKIEKLNDLEFIWNKETAKFNPKNKVWMERYEELKNWTHKYGEAHVPQTNKDKTPNKLGKWLNDQRFLKRKGLKRADGSRRYLEQERVDLLLEIGVDFDHETNKHIDSFERQIQEFLSFKYQYPNLNPPTGSFKV